MAQTPSTMRALGSVAPDFKLPDVVSGKQFSLKEFNKGKALVVLFICNHCPFVKHVAVELSALGTDYISKGVSFVAISSNDVVNYPDDAPDKMKEFALIHGFLYPYLYDETQQVAKAYDAACTPDFFIYDANLRLVYRGQLDESRPSNNIPVTGKDIRSALEQILKGEPVAADQKPSIGCNIKWKK